MEIIRAKQGGVLHIAYPAGGALCRYLYSAVRQQGKLPTCPRCIAIWNGTKAPVHGRDPQAIRGRQVEVGGRP